MRIKGEGTQTGMNEQDGDDRGQNFPKICVRFNVSSKSETIHGLSEPPIAYSTCKQDPF